MTTGDAGIEILLIEDDVDVRTTTARLLVRRGFRVRIAADAEQGFEELAEHPVDLVVADVGLPGRDGVSFTAMVRRTSRVPILLLTARDLPSDVIAGLEAGADDYLTKPFDGDVLVARLRALERRAHGTALPVVRFGDVTVDRAGRGVFRSGAPVTVSSTEFRLLEALIDARGAAVTRQQVLHRVWTEDRWIDERVVDTNVLRLRAKLGEDVITTVRGFGYRLGHELRS